MLELGDVCAGLLAEAAKAMMPLPRRTNSSHASETAPARR
jgi:hypothetical protein